MLLKGIDDAVRRGFESLTPNARAKLTGFISASFLPDGGVRGDGGKADLYYTMFGLDLADAAGAAAPKDKTREWLEGMDPTKMKRLMNYACWARCLSRTGGAPPARAAETWKHALPAFDGPNGFFSGSEQDSLTYALFLARISHEALGLDGDPPAGLHRQALPAINDHDTTPVLAAGVLLRSGRAFGESDSIARELLTRRAGGGFKAARNTRIPDVLSTGTALYALSCAGMLERAVWENGTEFIELHWNEETGGFSGTILDDRPDCEYTLYALLGLGSEPAE